MTYSAPSQILARHLPYIENKHLLLAGELEDTFASELLQHAASVNIFSTHFAYAQQIKQIQNINVQFGADYIPFPKIDVVVLYWPKAKAEAVFLLNMLLAAHGQKTEVIVIGENRSGIKSIEKLFTPFGHITKYDSARRCSFYWGECLTPPSDFDFQSQFTTYTLELNNDEKIEVCALPGVFSQQKLDIGTQVLINNLPSFSGDILDFGCGAGVIGAIIKKRFPDVHIEMVDVSALAIASAMETLRVNKLTGHVFASDGYSDITTCYDHIISNPPFHAGLKTHYDVTETFLLDAPRHLKKEGKLTLVANSFLRYRPFIEKGFATVGILNKTTQFIIYHAQ